MKKSTLTLLLSVITLYSFSTTYYVSPNGNDNNSGTSQGQAWKTIAKVNENSWDLNPGDQVLFERGATYRGKIIITNSGTPSSPIIYGAYGSGPKPIISGSSPVNTWTVHSGNIWVADYSGPVTHLYSDGDLQTKARFPNTGWLRNDNGNSTYITDAALTQPNGYWTGSEAVIRTTNWSYDVTPITAFSGSTITFDNTGNNLDDNHWGYFIQDKFEELDQAGEWFYNESTDKVYFWAPGNADPNNLNMEVIGGVDYGVHIYSNKHDVRVEYLHFKHQYMSGFKNSADLITLSNCKFTDLFKAVISYGSDNNYSNNVIQDAFGMGMQVIDNGTVIDNNTFTDVAMIPGLGENNWGYFGIRSIGANTTISNNTFNNIGYIGIDAKQNTLIENNVIVNATAILNDGGGIAFDDADGMIIRNNIVRDLVGNLESSAPNYHAYEPMCFGIYFGNTGIINTTVEGNTVANCSGTGIHVDHTMISAGNKIMNNVIYNNRTQIGFSDFSNYNGPGAQPPYYVAAYDNIVTGNVLYCLTKEQKCLNFLNVYTAAHTDFGTFDNNFYFNPYNEQSIIVTDNYAGNIKYRYSLARWQNEFGKDMNSTDSPLNITKYEVTNVNSSNLATNGDFDYNVNNWDGWPNEGQHSHDFTYLDNGAMKVHFDDNTNSNQLNTSNTPAVSIQDQQYYRVKFSLQSDMFGELRVGFKADSEPWSTEMVHEHFFPFDDERREVEIIFQSDLNDTGHNHFFNDYDESTYWIDNIEMHEVDVVELDPAQKSVLFVNDQGTSQTFPLIGCYSDVNGNYVYDDIVIPPFSSEVLVKEDDALCGISTGIEENDMTQQVYVYPSPVSPSGVIEIAGITTNAKVELFNLSGARVLIDNVSAQNSKITIPELVTGLYIVQVSTENSGYTTKLVVQ